ncbi:MAG: hypothetical protein FWG68_07125 [Defluviitaleaceae bacterium]|nr:hypothetical protein [Defluviitaleaceae bacterium]
MTRQSVFTNRDNAQPLSREIARAIRTELNGFFPQNTTFKNGKNNKRLKTGRKVE